MLSAIGPSHTTDRPLTPQTALFKPDCGGFEFLHRFEPSSHANATLNTPAGDLSRQDLAGVRDYLNDSPQPPLLSPVNTTHFERNCRDTFCNCHPCLPSTFPSFPATFQFSIAPFSREIASPISTSVVMDTTTPATPPSQESSPFDSSPMDWQPEPEVSAIRDIESHILIA